MKIIAVFLTLALLAGCATAPPAPLYAGGLFKAKAMATTSSVADIQTGFVQTLADCQGVLYGFEQKSDNLKWWSVAIQLAGGIVGSIILPAYIAAGTVAKSTVAALGGFAGFTNTAISTVRNEGLGAADVIRERASVQASMQVALTKYYTALAADPIDKAKAVASIDELKVACISYWLASPMAPAILGQ